MAETQRSRREILDEAFEEMSPTIADGEGVAMCTGYVVLAEWSDSNGRIWMTTSTADRMPSWRARGLLSEALADLDRAED